MATKEQLIKNLREYSAADIAQSIRDGQVSIYELSKSGNLSPLMRRRIEAQLAESPAPAPAAAPATEATAPEAPGAAIATATETATAVATEETAIHPIPEPQSAQPVQQAQPAKQMQPVQEQVPAQAPTPPPYVQAPPMPPAYQQVQQAPPISPQVNAQSYPLYEGPDAIDNHGMFRRPMSIKGRIRRTEFCLSYLMYLLIVPIFAFMAEESDYNPALSVATVLIYFIGIWFMIAQGIKRCHDLGRSGWYQLIPFYFLVMMFGSGEVGYNEYGSDPKQ